MTISDAQSHFPPDSFVAAKSGNTENRFYSGFSTISSSATENVKPTHHASGAGPTHDLSAAAEHRGAI